MRIHRALTLDLGLGFSLPVFCYINVLQYVFDFVLAYCGTVLTMPMYLFLFSLVEYHLHPLRFSYKQKYSSIQRSLGPLVHSDTRLQALTHVNPFFTFATGFAQSCTKVFFISLFSLSLYLSLSLSHTHTHTHTHTHVHTQILTLYFVFSAMSSYQFELR